MGKCFISSELGSVEKICQFYMAGHRRETKILARDGRYQDGILQSENELERGGNENLSGSDNLDT